MKKILLFSVFIVAIMVACGKDETNQSTKVTLQNEWQYIAFTEIEGPPCFYEREEKIVTFTSDQLIMQDNYVNDDVCSFTFIADGTYDYEVRLIDATEYLFIEGEERGRISFVDGDLLIESSYNTSGVRIADAPTYTLKL